jgi:UDP-2,3-diacylglucosamine hydrolase
MERPLGLMCGAGVLPARVAVEAGRRGYRVLAFTFAGEPPGLAASADRVIPSRISDLGAVFRILTAESVSAILFSGSFSSRHFLGVKGGDSASQEILARGDGSLTAAGLSQGLLAVLAPLGIGVLDQRPFCGDWMASVGALGHHRPGPEHRRDIDRGLDVARTLAALGVGQTVVVKRGVLTAVEAAEGTSEAIRRGLHLAGRGATVVKAVAPDNDYRFDVPSVGPETLECLAHGGASALAFEAGRVLVLEREQVAAIADAAGIAVVGVDGA